MSVNIVFLDTKSVFQCGDVVRGRFAIQGVERCEFSKIVVHFCGDLFLTVDVSKFSLANVEFCDLSCLVDQTGVFEAGEQREFEFRFDLPRGLPLTIKDQFRDLNCNRVDASISYAFVVEVTPKNIMEKGISRRLDVKLEPDLTASVKDSTAGSQHVQASTANVITKLFSNGVSLAFTLKSGFALIQKPMEYYLKIENDSSNVIDRVVLTCHQKFSWSEQQQRAAYGSEDSSAIELNVDTIRPRETKLVESSFEWPFSTPSQQFDTLLDISHDVSISLYSDRKELLLTAKLPVVCVAPTKRNSNSNDDDNNNGSSNSGGATVKAVNSKLHRSVTKAQKRILEYETRLRDQASALFASSKLKDSKAEYSSSLSSIVELSVSAKSSQHAQFMPPEPLQSSSTTSSSTSSIAPPAAEEDRSTLSPSVAVQPSTSSSSTTTPSTTNAAPSPVCSNVSQPSIVDERQFPVVPNDDLTRIQDRHAEHDDDDDVPVVRRIAEAAQ